MIEYIVGSLVEILSFIAPHFFLSYISFFQIGISRAHSAAFFMRTIGGDLVAVKITLDDAAALARLRQIESDTEKALSRTMSDIKSRGPSWIAKGVTKDYNLTTAKVKELSKLKVTGDGVHDVTFAYKGRVLSPSNFRMTPTAPTKPGEYTIKATIKRGERVTIGQVNKLTKKQRKNIGRNFTRKGTRNSPTSPPMLVSTGAKRTGSTSHIPFQRTKQPGRFDKVIKTLSVPQMIQDGQGNTKPSVKNILNENIEKRFNHHMDQVGL